MRATKPFTFAAMSRRAALTGAALAAMATLTGCGAAGGTAAKAEGDIGIGAPEGAKVTVVEYASVTCPHCAAWQNTTYEAFKAKYVDTNKVRYVFRELPTPPVEIAAAGFLLARCAGEDRYFDVIHEIMASQQEMFGGASQPRAVLLRIANGVGLSEEQFTACVTDKDAIAAMDERIRTAQDAGVTGTPAFYVNDTVVVSPGNEGATLEDLSKVIEAELAK